MLVSPLSSKPSPSVGALSFSDGTYSSFLTCSSTGPLIFEFVDDSSFLFCISWSLWYCSCNCRCLERSSWCRFSRTSCSRDGYYTEEDLRAKENYHKSDLQPILSVSSLIPLGKSSLCFNSYRIRLNVEKSTHFISWDAPREFPLCVWPARRFSCNLVPTIQPDTVHIYTKSHWLSSYA